MLFPGIVRNRLKIESAILNARCFLKVQEEFGSFASYSWQFVGGKPKVSRLARDRADSGLNARVGRIQQGPEEAGLQVRRHDDHVCAHAGDRHGQ